jgi:hypothetical protein
LDEVGNMVQETKDEVIAVENDVMLEEEME